MATVASDPANCAYSVRLGTRPPSTERRDGAAMAGMRVPLQLRHAARLLNHGPTTLITSHFEGRSNVMAAAWVMPLDFSPPKLGVVIAADTFTRTLVEGSRALVINLPTVAMLDFTFRAGSHSGRDRDKLDGVPVAKASKVDAPLLEGCVGWLEAVVLPDERLAKDLDLFVVEVVAAWVDDEAFVNGEWRFSRPEQHTLHHVTKGHFFATGAPLVATP